MEVLEIKYTDEDIKSETNGGWKKIVKKAVEKRAFQHLTKENKEKKKTNEIEYENFDMAEYLKRNSKETITKYIFKIRSGTIDLKSLAQWKYNDNLCVGCEIKEESMTHFMECQVYNVNEESTINWKDIYKNDMDLQIKVALEVERRFNLREKKIQEAGRDSNPSSKLLDSFV